MTTDEKLDELYKNLLAAQLNKNWGLCAKIQIEINRIQPFDFRATSEEREGKVEPNLPSLRDYEGAVR